MRSVINNKLLLTEHEDCTGASWPKVIAVKAEHSEVPTEMTKGQYSPVQP